jgi:hypothetical protein
MLPTLVLLAAGDAGAGPVSGAVSSSAPVGNDASVESIDITLYQGMGWVRELRRHRVPAGAADVTIAELPRIEAGTPQVRAADGMGALRVLGLDYQTGRMPPGDRLGSAIARIETEAGDRALEVSYLSTELMWNASYVATLPANGASARLVGSAHILNRSGRTFENATIRCVSGIASGSSGRDYDRSEMQPFAPLARLGGLPQSEKQALLELQSFDLTTATVRDEHTKAVDFMTAPAVPVRIEHSIAFHSSCGGWSASDNSVGQLLLVFRNDRASGLGHHLAGGMFSVLVEQADGERALLGRGSTGDVPEGELVRIHIGNTRDVVGTRTLIAYDGDRRTKEHERTYQVVLKNRKHDAVIATLRDLGSERIVRSDHAVTVSSGPEALCEILIPANGSVEVVYTARYRCGD